MNVFQTCDNTNSSPDAGFVSNNCVLKDINAFKWLRLAVIIGLVLSSALALTARWKYWNCFVLVYSTGRWSICWVLRWLSRRPCAWAECVFVCPELSVKDRLSRTRCVRLILGVYDWSPRCSSREDIMCVFFYEKVRWDRFGRFWGLDLKRIVFWNDKFVETFTHFLTLFFYIVNDQKIQNNSKNLMKRPYF